MNSRIELFTTPGCFEIPIMAQRLARRGRYDVMIALGAVIRGDTHHFELVANECARGVMEVSLKYDVPIVFEVLAVYRRQDAVLRAQDNRLNKGREAASAALALLERLNSLK
jgi:6,7-dimethyl-8-ribityllumazine synthase